MIYDPFQLKAIRAVDENKSVLVSAPTGAGKTAIAEYAIVKALERGERVIYTAPIKALSNQKYRDFSVRYPNQVGILTGDVSLNAQAPLFSVSQSIPNGKWNGWPPLNPFNAHYMKATGW